MKNLLPVFLLLAVASHAQQGTQLQSSFCSPISCAASETATTGSVTVEIQGLCYNQNQLFAGATALAENCHNAVVLNANGTTPEQQTLDDCGNLVVIDGVRVDVSVTTFTIISTPQTLTSGFSEDDCDGGRQDLVPPSYAC